MARATRCFATIATVALAVGMSHFPDRSDCAAAREQEGEPSPADPALNGSTITAVLDANGGKAPATGKELWQSLSKLGDFAQLPVVFSAVHMDSGIGNPRVVIVPAVTGLSDAGVTSPSLNGRLYLAANMEKDPKGGDPRVVSVEFISWNTLLRRFDFGVIENVGTDEPRVRVLDGGRCFACHKNKGPILGAGPWTNTTQHRGLRTLVSAKYNVVDVIPAGAVGLRTRIDGMALAAPQGQTVDDSVRLGAVLRLQRDTFRLMNRTDAGRKAFVGMLVAISQPGPLDPNGRQAKIAVDQWGNDQSYIRFANDWLALARTTNTGILINFAPIPKKLYEWEDVKFRTIKPPPPGILTAKEKAAYEKGVKDAVEFNEGLKAKALANLQLLALYDAERAAGKPAMPSIAQPSNPRAFIQPTAKATQKPSGMVNPLMLANTIGLTDGDRKFLAQSLDDASKRTKPKVPPATLAKEVFEGPEFANALKAGPLPDRDEFKDLFVAGLDSLLKTRYKLAEGFSPERKAYASGPRRDPKAVEEVEAAVVPTTACLRCHEVRDGAKPRLFDPIPSLAFDPFDKQARARWVQAADPKRKREVLARLLERLVTDADMPPQDSPEQELFRVKQAAAFDDLKQFLEAELDLPKKP